jgi:tRNA (guanine37-N1)-methyltransferase
MRIDVLTLFPEMFAGPLESSILGRAIAAGVASVELHNIRDYATDKHQMVDDYAYGGGPGMVMKPEPLVRALEHVQQSRGAPDVVLLLTPQGRTFTQREAERLAARAHIALLCGRYEGVDERVQALTGAQELSIGDYVLSGGEIPALVVIDAVSRLVPGVVGDRQSVLEDSFSRGMLDHPHYTRPVEFGGLRVPDVLLSGHHADVRRWRKRQALERTLARRPELVATADLDDEDRRLLAEIGKQERETGSG